MKMEESSRKRNMSFSINFDFNHSDNESCSDSESAGLQIDISEVDSFNPTNKVGKQSIDEPTFLNEMEEEIQCQLDAKAAKTNLTATNVKNILKQVLTHEQVVEMCHQKLTKSNGDFTFDLEPRLTRAKAKELSIVLPFVPLPQKNTDPEVQVLVQEDILEDSSDEEYDPEKDPHEDEDKEVESSLGSDIDSLPSTPATPSDLNNLEMPPTPEIQIEEEGSLDIPQILPHNALSEERPISHGTRSKLKHDETPTDVIRQSFIAPDLYCWDESDDDLGFDLEPRFTRAKAKELSKEPDIIPVLQKNISPEVKALKENLEILEDLLSNLDSAQTPEVQKIDEEIFKESQILENYQFTPEVQALVQEEISSEDSSDEDYNPEQEDKDVGSDIESQPSIPAIPCDLSAILEMLPAPEVQYDEDGIFKIPQIRPHHLTTKEERPISHGTRSKVKLEETPIEVIEQSLVAPDVTTDQCYWDLDPDYTTFLNSTYYQPIPKEDIDDPDDPEYIQLEVEDYEEELKKGKGFEIPMEEVKSLIAELSDYADQYIDTKQQEERKQQLQKTLSIEEPTISNEQEIPFYFTAEQRRLLSVQMSYHVQLAAQQFLMTVKHPKLHKQSEICKQFLLELKMSGEIPFSSFTALNLDEALKLIDQWESKLLDPSFLEEYYEWLNSELETAHTFANSKRRYKINFHFELIKLMCNSKALMHPYLLPELFPDGFPAKKDYLLSEEHLIAIGLEEYIPVFKRKERKFFEERYILIDALKEVQKFKTPTRDPLTLLKLVKSRKRGKTKYAHDNPIKFYFETGSSPKVSHRLLNNYELNPPLKQFNSLSPRWQNYVENLNNGSLKKLLSSSSIQRKGFDDMENSFCPPHIEIIIPPSNHELRNPIVNMMKRMSSLLASQKNESSKTAVKNNSRKPRLYQPKTNETKCDTETNDNLKTCEMKEEESRTSRLRLTSPRLAKIKSVQNMKLLAQNMSKNSGSSPSSSRNQDKNDDSISFVKGDNEDEIAELMLASTTIKKNTSNRKKSKQAREFETVKRLMEAENNINEDERATKFASSFIQRLHDALESKDPELLKTIEKILVDYSEKLESSNQTNSDPCLNNIDSGYDSSNIQTQEKIFLDKDKFSIDLYKEIYEKLRDYKDLCYDLLLFLTPNQAALIDQSVEYTMLEKMKNFVNVFLCFFAKQPSRIEKIMQAMTQIAMDPYVTVEKAQALMATALKGYPQIMELFVQTMPQAKPPESLFAEHMFENLSCPVGPHDKNKPYDEDSPELYENIELPVSTQQEDPYGGDSCKCDCHNCTDDLKSRGGNEHCASCGTKFLNGKIYLQTPDGLRPAKITFPGEDDEKLENISRVSLKMTERILPCQPPKKRRKTSKRDSISEESFIKPGPSKGSPIKNVDENDKTTSKLKKNVKSPPKTIDQKKLNKVQSASVKSNREKKNDKKYSKTELKTDDEQTDSMVITDQLKETTATKFGETSTDSHEDDNTSPEKMNISSTSNEKLVSSDSDCSENSHETAASISWTIEEDKILLKNLQENPDTEKCFETISLTLKNRSIEQVKKRCEELMNLLLKNSG